MESISNLNRVWRAQTHTVSDAETTLTRDDVEKLYPDTYKTFTKIRNELDPDRVFANSMLDELFPRA